jgi:predicted nuclease of predicted toxin-antitoxin system
VKFKLDENLSPSLATLFASTGHEAVCAEEQRALVTLDLDFSNILAYPPASFTGIVVLRLTSQSHVSVESAIGRVLELLSQESLLSKLWIVEDHRIRIRG